MSIPHMASRTVSGTRAGGLEPACTLKLFDVGELHKITAELESQQHQVDEFRANVLQVSTEEADARWRIEATEASALLELRQFQSSALPEARSAEQMSQWYAEMAKRAWQQAHEDHCHEQSRTIQRQVRQQRDIQTRRLAEAVGDLQEEEEDPRLLLQAEEVQAKWRLRGKFDPAGEMLTHTHALQEARRERAEQAAARREHLLRRAEALREASRTPIAAAPGGTFPGRGRVMDAAQAEVQAAEMVARAAEAHLRHIAVRRAVERSDQEVQWDRQERERQLEAVAAQEKTAVDHLLRCEIRDDECKWGQLREVADALDVRPHLWEDVLSKELTGVQTRASALVTGSLVPPMAIL
eukprot:RCo034856